VADEVEQRQKEGRRGNAQEGREEEKTTTRRQFIATSQLHTHTRSFPCSPLYFYVAVHTLLFSSNPFPFFLFLVVSRRSPGEKGRATWSVRHSTREKLSMLSRPCSTSSVLSQSHGKSWRLLPHFLSSHRSTPPSRFSPSPRTTCKLFPSSRIARSTSQQHPQLTRFPPAGLPPKNANSSSPSGLPSRMSSRLT
jgi:hypothetical protein